MKNVLLYTEDEYLLTMRKHVDGLKARSNQAQYKYADREQSKIVAHFIGRAIQVGEAAYRIRDLEIPLDSIMRILSDDMIRLYWITESESNAAEFATNTKSQWLKLMIANLEKGNARIVHKPTGKTATAEFLPQIKAHVVKGKPIEQIAGQCGLQKVYDMPFRFGSLSIHGNTFLPGMTDEVEPSAIKTLPAINAFLKVIIQIVDEYPNRRLTPEEIEKMLKLPA